MAPGNDVNEDLHGEPLSADKAPTPQLSGRFDRVVQEETQPRRGLSGKLLPLAVTKAPTLE